MSRHAAMPKGSVSRLCRGRTGRLQDQACCSPVGSSTGGTGCDVATGRQEYLIKLLGRYRDYVAPDAHADHYEGHPNGRAEADGCLRWLPRPDHAPVTGPTLQRGAAGASAACAWDKQPQQPGDRRLMTRCCWFARRAHGWRFDHAAFVASFRSAKTRAFLSHLRESQCYEVFISERLAMAAQGMGAFDAFETKVGCEKAFSVL